MSCSTKDMQLYTTGCDLNNVNQIKTIEVDVNDAESIKMAIAESKRTGQPVLIDGSKISIAQAIYAGALLKSTPMLPVIDKRAVPIVNPELAMEGQSKIQNDREKNRDLQLKELNAASGIPEATRNLIAAEYMRLRTKHKDWKAHRLMRKAGEKYNVKFDFE